MESTSRSTQLVINHRIIMVTVAIVVLIAVAGGAALLTTMRPTQSPDAQSAADAQQRQLSMERHDYIDWTLQHVVTTSASDHERTDLIERFIASPGRPGFINPATDRVATAVWTYRP